MIYSDNIYFAKAALKIGTEEMERSLSMLGFHSSIPFEIMMAESKFSNNKHIQNDSHGTGYAIHRKDMILAGKTGTAEIKESQSDTTGTELGWFAVMTPDKKNKKPILIVSMVEDVKGIGGSGYVVKKDKAVLNKWFGKN